MRKTYLLLLLGLLFILASCAPQQEQTQELDYDQTKKMVVDILKTDEGKKAIQELMADEQMKSKLVMDQGIVNTSVQNTLVSVKGQQFWQKAFEDPKFADAFAKSMQTQHEKLIKGLMKDPEYQAMLLSLLQNPEMAKQMGKVIQSNEMRVHLQKVMTETFESPIYQAKIQGILIKAAQEMQAEKKASEES